MSYALSVCHGAFGRAALYKLNSAFVTHAHREGHLIFYLDGCRGCVPVGDEEIRIDETTAVGVSPWQPHSFRPYPADGSSLCLVLYIVPTWFLRATQSAKFAFNFGRAKIDVTGDIEHCVRRLARLLVNQELSTSFDGTLLEITRLCYDQSWAGLDEDAMHSDELRCCDYRIRRSLKLLRTRLHQDVSICELARDVGLSRPHFFQLFKKHFGITPNVYLNTLRSEQAICDLLGTELSVTDIGINIGFSSQASFTRFFTANVGIPPSEYRRRAHVYQCSRA